MVIALFNGIHYPFAVAEKAIAHSQKTGDNITGVFLLESEQKEGYGFPSDLDEAEELFSTQDANSADRRVVDSNCQMFENSCIQASVSFHTTVKVNPSIDDVKTTLATASVIFVSSMLDEYHVGAVSSINFKSLFTMLKAPVNYVAE